jgi:hypothetical protein
MKTLKALFLSPDNQICWTFYGILITFIVCLFISNQYQFYLAAELSNIVAVLTIYFFYKFMSKHDLPPSGISVIAQLSGSAVIGGSMFLIDGIICYSLSQISIGKGLDVAIGQLVSMFIFLVFGTIIAVREPNQKTTL